MGSFFIIFFNIFFLCLLSSESYKTSCGVIAGRADKSLEDCIGAVTTGGCEAFIEEECEYLGEDSGFSAPSGELTNAAECEGYCKGFEVNPQGLVYIQTWKKLHSRNRRSLERF